MALRGSRAHRRGWNGRHTSGRSIAGRGGRGGGRGGGRVGGRLPAVLLSAAGARAARRGGPALAAARRSRLPLVRHPAGVPRVRRHGNDGHQRHRRAAHGPLSDAVGRATGPAAAGGDAEQRRDHQRDAGRGAGGTDGPLRPGGGRGRGALRGRGGRAGWRGLRRHHHLRHGRHEHRRGPVGRRPAGRARADNDRRPHRRAAAAPAADRHPRGRRQSGLSGRGRGAASRATERRGRARPGLLLGGL